MGSLFCETSAVLFETPLEKSAARKPKAAPAPPPKISEITTTAEIGVFLRFFCLSHDGVVGTLPKPGVGQFEDSTIFVCYFPRVIISLYLPL